MNDTDQPRKRSRLRRLTNFSLRTALIAITILAVWLGLHMNSVRKQRASIEAVHKYGGSVFYDYALKDHTQLDTNAESSVPLWLLNVLGRDHFHDVAIVDMPNVHKEGERWVQNDNRSDKVLGQLGGLTKLESLLISQSQATDDGMKEVGKLGSLRRLYMWDAEVTDQGVAHLAKLRKLEHLHISNSQVSDESLRILAQLPELQSLSLQGGRFTDHGLEHVQHMTQLRELVLGLGANEITDDGLLHLSELTQLERLGLQKSHVTENGLRHLSGLKNLKELWLNGSQVEDASWLKKRLPNCKIGTWK